MSSPSVVTGLPAASHNPVGKARICQIAASARPSDPSMPTPSRRAGPAKLRDLTSQCRESGQSYETWQCSLSGEPTTSRTRPTNAPSYPASGGYSSTSPMKKSLPFETCGETSPVASPPARERFTTSPIRFISYQLALVWTAGLSGPRRWSIRSCPLSG